jgi:3-phenylpropionate/trans-cinnamate dioxygenase ferredoxin component
MSEFTKVAKSGQVGEGEVAAFEVGGERISVAHVEGSLYAFSDICTHAHCSLADGELEGTTVTCPCHGSQFDVTTGAVLNPPATEPVAVFPVRVEEEEIQVQL